MNYNLKETKTSDAETLLHCITVLNGYLQEDTKNSWKKAEKYLKSYIFELFKQNN